MRGDLLQRRPDRTGSVRLTLMAAFIPEAVGQMIR